MAAEPFWAALAETLPGGELEAVFEATPPEMQGGAVSAVRLLLLSSGNVVVVGAVALTADGVQAAAATRGWTRRKQSMMFAPVGLQLPQS